MSNIEHLLSNRLKIAENKFKLHDKEIAQKNEQIAHLLHTIGNMQKASISLNSLLFFQKVLLQWGNQ